MRRKYVESPVMLTIRMRRAEQDELRAAAKRADLPLTEWIRRTLFLAAGLPLDGAHRKPGWPLGRPRTISADAAPPVDCQDGTQHGRRSASNGGAARRTPQNASAQLGDPDDGPERPDAA